MHEEWIGTAMSAWMGLGNIVVKHAVTRKYSTGNCREISRPHTVRMNRVEPLPARRRRLGDVVRMRDLLRSEILDGCWETGLLPSESELMLRYATGRNVTRDALDLLKVEGLVERIQGSGTFIVNGKSRHRFDRVHSLHDSQSAPRRLEARFITVTSVDAPGPVAMQLGLAGGSRCTLLEFVTTVEGSPVSMTTSYMRPDVGSLIGEQDFSGDFYQLLESLGIRVAFAEQSVEAVAAESSSAHYLDIAVGAPVLLFRRRLVGNDGAVVEVGFVRFRGDRISLDVRLPRTKGEGIR
ncbi:MAG: yvoA 3 [Modestobacter sp.]|jgi:GntR family transcriptional regulator|nr:yvoA 3 [Modestobacter sp.]